MFWRKVKKKMAEGVLGGEYEGAPQNSESLPIYSFPNPLTLNPSIVAPSFPITPKAQSSSSIKYMTVNTGTLLNCNQPKRVSPASSRISQPHL